MNLFFSTMQQMLLFLPLSLGVYISYRILAVTDLTVDGTFILGAAVFAKMVTGGINQYLSLAAAVCAGACAGALVACMQKITRINSLIASVLAVFMLYSVNFKIMGKPNISLLESNAVIASLQNTNERLFFIVILLLALAIISLLVVLLHSRLGLLLRAYGSNIRFLHSIGKSTIALLVIGLAISNGLAALGGVLAAQINGYADLSMGIGVALTAIGAVVIGQHLAAKIFHRIISFNACIGCLSCIIGTFIYFLAMNIFLQLGINPIYLKLLLGIVLTIFLATAAYSKKGDMVYE